MDTLYISYDGILEPLQQSQVVNYVLRLGETFDLTLITFEKGCDLRDRRKVWEMAARLRAAGIRWIPLTYHKWPPVLSTAWDALVGTFAGLFVCLTGRVRVLHARGYVSALIAVLLKRITGAKLLFAIEGFWADEKVEGGHWSRRSKIYAITKRCEKTFFAAADAVVTLTMEGAKAIPELGCAVRPGVPIEVIPTCADLDRFAPGPKDPALAEALGVTGYRIVGCVGTMSSWYLRRSMLDYLAYLMHHLEKTKILVVTREDHELLRADAAKAGIPPGRLVLTRAEFSAMPAHVRLMDVGVFFIRACFGKKASAPTKLGEFLGCGVPVIINDGVGDSGWIARQHRAGVVLADTTPRDFERSLAEINRLFNDPGTATRCRDAARRYFDLAVGTRKYAALYRELMGAWAPAGKHAGK